MTKYYAPIIIFVIMLPIFFVGLNRNKSELPSPLIGKTTPSFVLPSLIDPSITIDQKSINGRFVLFNVWATWCVGCREEHQFLMNLSKRKEIAMVGLNWRDNRADALNWLVKLGNPYELTIEDKLGRTAIDWGVYGAPETFLINSNGIIIHKHLGPLTEEDWNIDFKPLITATQ
ncbi:MAG: DsbE family thiol:disulfide interchange protein [Woeseiaceae bacterium]|nr:DsbE family thiol:disulfide interchange protein [Woeseiaceae bacterium]